MQVGIFISIVRDGDFSMRKITTKIVLGNVFYITRHSEEKDVFITMET